MGLTCCAHFFLSSSCCWRILVIAFWCCSASSGAHTWSVVAIGEGGKKSQSEKKKITEWRLGPGPMERVWEAGATVWGAWSPPQKCFSWRINFQRQLLKSPCLWRPSFMKRRSQRPHLAPKIYRRASDSQNTFSL